MRDPLENSEVYEEGPAAMKWPGELSSITIGFALMLFVGTAQAQKIYWIERDTARVRVGSIDGSLSPTDRFDSSDGLNLPRYIAVDVVGEKAYWSDYESLQPTSGKISLGNTDGSGMPTVLFDNSDGVVRPGSIALDVAGGKIYWNDWGTQKVQVGNIDGSGSPTDLFDSLDGVDAPFGIALDIAGGKIYFGDAGGAAKIQVGNIDGSGSPTVLFDAADGVDSVQGIALDVTGGKIYWTEFANFRVRVGNIDGSGTPTVLFDDSDGLNGPHDIALDLAAGKVYWSANAGSAIRVGNIDGSGSPADVYNPTNGLPVLSRPEGIALDLTAAPPPGPLPVSSKVGLVLLTLLLVASVLVGGRNGNLALYRGPK